LSEAGPKAGSRASPLAMKSKRSSPTLRTRPGSFSSPIIEKDLPEPVCPYAKIDAL